MYNIRIILDMVDAINQSEVKQLLEFLNKHVTEVVVYDKKRLYSEYIPDNRQIIYNPKDELQKADLEIYSVPLLICKDGGIFVSALDNKKYLRKMFKRTGLYIYEHNKVQVNRKLNKFENINIKGLYSISENDQNKQQK